MDATTASAAAAATTAATAAHSDAAAILAKKPAAPELETGHIANVDATTAAAATAAATAANTAHADAAAILAKQPSAPATATNQATEIASLASIATNTAGGSSYPADVASTGNALNSATLNAAYTVSLARGEGVTRFAVSGLTASAATAVFEGSDDGGTTWTAINEFPSAAGVFSNAITADGQYDVKTAGLTKVRLRVSVVGTGAVTVASNSSTATSKVALSGPAWVQAAPSSFQACAIFDIGCGATPAANTVNGNLLQLHNDLTSTSGVPVKAQDSAGHDATDTTLHAIKVSVVGGLPVVGTSQYAISTSSSGVAQVIAASSGKAIYITHWDVVLAAAGTFQLEYGTGTNCGTGTTALTGAYSFAANGGISSGGGSAPVIVVPASQALCINNGSAVAAAGEITYAQQ